MALKRRGFTVNAITLDQADVDYATDKGIVDYATTTVEPTLVAEADLVIFALYPHTFVEWLEQHGRLLTRGTVITDVTGVKGGIIPKIEALLPDGVEYIAAHPMAGREVGGVRNADDRIFYGANYIVVPTDRNTPEAIELCEELGWTLGFRYVSKLSPERHDEMIGFLSQLTHCIAVSLMCAKDDPELVRYTGDSFRDLTRIARINDAMWSELFLENQTVLLEEMDRFRKSFDRLYDTIRDGDTAAMRQMMRLSTERRTLFDKP
ncbi:MAG: prephenate dehydrogenase [Clostridia bacterium]|nr:prephenate dehydrogenase [Clostridia bacterium]